MLLLNLKVDTSMMFRTDGECSTILLDDTIPCPACHAAHYVFVNAHGHTTCISCYVQRPAKPLHQPASASIPSEAAAVAGSA